MQFINTTEILQSVANKATLASAEEHTVSTGRAADKTGGGVRSLLVKPDHLHADVLDLTLGITQHRLSFGEHLLVTSCTTVVCLNHVLRTLLHLRRV